MDNKILYRLNELEKLENGEYVNPISVEIDPSLACNLDCKFCMFSKYRKASNAIMSMENYIKLVYNLKHIGVKSITFSGGGEPLMNPKFNEMVKLALDLGFEIGLVTNGVLLNKVHNKNKFKFIRVSLNAATRETYKNITGVDVFDKVVENIKNSVNETKCLGISFVVCEENKKEINYIKELGESLGVSYVQVKPASIDGKLYKYTTKEDEITINTQRHKPTSMSCNIAHLTGIISADGLVYYCCQKRGDLLHSLGSINNDTFENIWKTRMDHKVDSRRCNTCRYANYEKAYKKFKKDGGIFTEHKNFL